jgi:hypothetical protein
LKDLLGQEIKAYAHRHNFQHPVSEGNRCWRLDYADHVLFHMDILPCVPEDTAFIQAIQPFRIDRRLAATSVAITDKRHPKYQQIATDWFSSNPRGLGSWFEDRARPAAAARMAELVRKMEYRSIDEVPSYRWKTPLQQAIQLLKRHRDVIFKDNPELAPISMIITILAAKAYRGELVLKDAIEGIVERMPQLVCTAKPRIPNPLNPNEDFADRWADDIRLEENFWLWHSQLAANLATLPNILDGGNVAHDVRKLFRVDLTHKQLQRSAIAATDSQPAEPKAGTFIHVPSSPRPWRQDG